MSDPSALLQHILSAVEQIKVSQQSLQHSHHELQTQFAASKVDLEAKFAALSLTLAPNSPPPVLPETISPPALETLVAHPFLSDADRLYAQVLQLAHRLVTPDLDASVLQSAYSELAGRVADAVEDASTATPLRPTASAAPTSPGVYVSKSGRRFDTSKPPPYPCRRCGRRHWVAGPGASSCPTSSGSASFSRRGAHSPAPAPRKPSTAGSQ